MSKQKLTDSVAAVLIIFGYYNVKKVEGLWQKTIFFDNGLD